jgi:hypothetical protein
MKRMNLRGVVLKMDLVVQHTDRGGVIGRSPCMGADNERDESEGGGGTKIGFGDAATDSSPDVRVY